MGSSVTLWPLTIAFAARWPQQRGQKADRGALAGAVRADEAEHFAGPDFEVQILHGDELAVHLGEVTKFDH